MQADQCFLDPYVYSCWRHIPHTDSHCFLRETIPITEANTSCQSDLPYVSSFKSVRHVWNMPAHLHAQMTRYMRSIIRACSIRIYFGLENEYKQKKKNSNCVLCEFCSGIFCCDTVVTRGCPYKPFFWRGGIMILLPWNQTVDAQCVLDHDMPHICLSSFIWSINTTLLKFNDTYLP